MNEFKIRPLLHIVKPLQKMSVWDKIKSAWHPAGIHEKGNFKENETKQKIKTIKSYEITVVPTKSGSDVIVCSQLLSKKLTCTLHLS